jgi:hypothetical protein
MQNAKTNKIIQRNEKDRKRKLPLDIAVNRTLADVVSFNLKELY